MASFAHIFYSIILYVHEACFEKRTKNYVRFKQEYGDYDAESAPRVRRRSSLSDTVPRVNNANFEDANMVSFSCLF